jgi:transposase
LTGGEAADCKAYDALIDLPERAPNALLADKGYDADAIRADLAERKIEAVIPGRSNVTGLSAPPRARPDFPRYWRSSSDFGRRLGGNFHA